MGRIVLASIIVLAIIMVSGCTAPNTQPGEKTRVSMRLPIPLWNAWFASLASAQELGYFDEEGLDESINTGTPELNPVKMVVSGADDFGLLGGPDTLLVARSKGAPIVAIAVIQHDQTFPCIVTLKESGITTVEQLEGKKIGLFYSHISTDIIRALMKQEGVSFTEVDVGGYNYTPLISGQVDAEWCVRTDGPLDLKSQGFEVNVIKPQDYGILVDMQTIFTTKNRIKEKPETVEKFLRALIKGVDFSLENEEQAIEFLSRKNRTFNAELEMKRLEKINSAVKTPETEQFGIGYMNKEMWERAYNRMKEAGQIEQEFDVSTAYTTEFLDKIHGSE